MPYKDKQKAKEHKKEYYQKNKKNILIKQKEHDDKNREKIHKYQKEYRKTQMGRASKQVWKYTQMDITKGFGKVIDFDAKWIVDNIYTKKCAHCDETDWHKLGCNRLDNSKPHTKDNVEPCCFKCNVKLR